MSRLGEYAAPFRLVVTSLMLALQVPCCAAPPCKTVGSPHTALMLFRNSHSTALAAMAEYHGLRKRNESDRVLIATCWMYAQFCECDMPGKPMLWRLGWGARRIFAARGYPHALVSEKCLKGGSAADRATFSEVAGAIDRNHPVIVTFCYDPEAARGLIVAKRRVDHCFSALAIGYVNSGGQHYLICQDGLKAGQTCAASADRVSPTSIGLPAHGAWSRPGAGLYKWEGKATNLVFVFVGNGEK